jgi:hypothetical protein
LLYSLASSPTRTQELTTCNFNRYDCNATPAQDWIVRRGSTKVRVAGTHNFCLDAGDRMCRTFLVSGLIASTIFCVAPFTDGRKMKIWECVNVPAQQWYYTDDDRIALEGQGRNRCLYSHHATRRILIPREQGSVSTSLTENCRTITRFKSGPAPTTTQTRFGPPPCRRPLLSVARRVEYCPVRLNPVFLGLRLYGLRTEGHICTIIFEFRCKMVYFSSVSIVLYFSQSRCE